MLTLDTLQPRLRQLKLSGMGEAIGPRAEEARARQLDPLEFLLLLLDDELARRDADNVARRIRAARFEDSCDLRDFDFSYNPELPKAQLWELASGRFIDEHAAVLLCGPTGVGKSFVAQALGVAGVSPAAHGPLRQDQRLARRPGRRARRRQPAPAAAPLPQPQRS